MVAFDSKYAFELWSSAGSLLADLSGRAKNRYFSMQRNEAELVQWDMDLNDFEAFCRSIGVLPTSILQSGVTEIRVKRGGTYIMGGKVLYYTPLVDQNQQKLSVRGTGFLNLFSDRYLPIYRNFSGVQTGVIATTMITESQTGGNVITNSDFETDLTGWSASGAGVSQSSVRSYIGSKSMQVIYSATGQYVSYNYNTFDTSVSYQGGIWAYIPAGKQVSINITWGGGSGSTSQTYTGTGAWQFIQTNAQVAGNASGQLRIVSVTGGSFTIYLDAAIMSITDAIVSPYIDGINVLDFGITMGSIATTGTRSRNYRRDNIKDALKELANNQSNAIDFEFTYDKKFNVYTSIGSTRSDIVFEYPRNIKSFSFTSDATQMGNQIIGIGAGNGAVAQLVYPSSDSTSLKTYKLHQRIYNNSAQDNTDNALADGVNIELQKWANPIRLLNITVDGNVSPYVTDYKIGDRVQITINNFQVFNQINGMYRIEKIEVLIDDDDNEEVVLTVSP